MKRLIPVAFLFIGFLLPHLVFAQQYKAIPALREIDSLESVLKIKNNDTNKVNTLNKLSSKYTLLTNYNSALLYAENAQTLAEKIGFKKGVADAFRNIGLIYFHQSNYQKALEYQYKAFAIYQDIGNGRGVADAYIGMGGIYFALGNYSKSLEYDFKVLPIVQKIKDTSDIATVFCNIGIIYGEQGNQLKALEYLFRSLEIDIKKGGKDDVVIDLGNIGYSYLDQGNYPKALEYDLKAVKQAQEVGDKDAIADFLGDIGNIYYKQGDYDRALEYDSKAVSIAQEIGNMDEVANLYSGMGAVYTKLKNYKQAKIFLDSALGFSKKIGDKKYTENTYSNIATLDSAIHNYETAYNDYKIYITYRDSILNEGTTQMELSYEFEKREDSIRAEYRQENIIKTAEINRKKILNDSAIVILALTVLLALLFINRQQIKRKKDKLFFENELANAKAMLEDYVKNMAEKNRLLEQFKVDLERIERLKTKEVDENRIERLEHLNKTTILTDEDWSKFKELFEQVYKGFFIRLKEKLPDLTQAEIRLVCLTKLKLDTKQMADILGVSYDAIRMTRHRLRKKLGLVEDTGIEDIAKSI